MNKFNITKEERDYLRELAKKQLEYSQLDIMKEREKRWYEHNSLNGDRPLVIMEIKYCLDDICEAPKCTSKEAIEIEKEILTHITNHELVDDDKVIPSYHTVYWKIDIVEFGLELKVDTADDGDGKQIGYAIEHPIVDLKNDLSILKPSTYTVDREYTNAWVEFVEEVIGDILPVKVKLDPSYNWYLSPSKKAVHLMGLENMMFSIMDYPDYFHKFYRFMTDDVKRHLKWLEDENLLVINNGNDYAGSGSYGFTHELPSEQCKKTGIVTPKDMWANLNSQETVGISPSMYEEFIFPYYKELAGLFGQVYYGCCEPNHDIWENCVSKLPNLRKVSVNPWTNEEFMAEVLRDNKVIYSRKPSPNYLAIKGSIDEIAYREHIAKTIKVARNNKLEIICRDIYSLYGDREKLGRGVQLIREEIQKHW